MAKNYYLPNSDNDRVAWFDNFSTKFAVTAAILGLTADVAWVMADAAMLTYTMNLVDIFTAHKEHLVDFKNQLRNGPAGQNPLTMLPAPVVAAPPTPVLGGVFQRTAALVQRIKKSPSYTDAIGKELGIIGSEIMMAVETMQPEIKPVIKGGVEVEIQWKKGQADALYIETDKGSGWQFLAVDTVPHYTDTTPITAPANWKYRAAYLINDKRVGTWSDIKTITVG